MWCSGFKYDLLKTFSKLPIVGLREPLILRLSYLQHKTRCFPHGYSSVLTLIAEKKNSVGPTMAASKEGIDLENYDNTSTANMLLTTPRKMKSGSRCRNCITLVFSSIGIIFLLLGYIICGAIVFSNIEGNYSTHKGMLKKYFLKMCD